MSFHAAVRKPAVMTPTALPQPLGRPTFCLLPGVRLARNLESGTPVAVTADGRSFTLGMDLADLCRELAAGPATVDELVCRLAGRGWDDAAVRQGIVALVSRGLGQRVGRAPVRPKRRWSALTLGFFDPEPVCRRLGWWARALRGGWGLGLSLVGVAGQITLLVLLPASADGPYGAGLVALALLAVVIVLHELAHGVVLAAAGGHPRRMGLMVVYFLPALFCDVSDAIRLPRQAQVETALAGLAAQCQVGLLLAPVAWLGGPAPWGVSVFLSLNLVTATANLLPFLPLDGYIAVAAFLGRPDLRSRAVGAWRSVLHRRGGGTGPRPWLLVVFGALCQGAPVVVAVVVVVTLAVRLAF